MRPQKALEIALARAESTVPATAAKYGCSLQTVEGAVRQVRDDPALLEAFRARRAQASRDLHDDRVAVLRAGLREILRRIETMGDKELVQAVQAVAEIHEVANVALQAEEGTVSVESTVEGRAGEAPVTHATVRHTYRAT